MGCGTAFRGCQCGVAKLVRFGGKQHRFYTSTTRFGEASAGPGERYLLLDFSWYIIFLFVNASRIEWVFIFWTQCFVRVVLHRILVAKEFVKISSGLSLEHIRRRWSWLISTTSWELDVENRPRLRFSSWLQFLTSSYIFSLEQAWCQAKQQSGSNPGTRSFEFLNSCFI